MKSYEFWIDYPYYIAARVFFTRKGGEFTPRYGPMHEFVLQLGTVNIYI